MKGSQETSGKEDVNAALADEVQDTAINTQMRVEDVVAFQNFARLTPQLFDKDFEVYCSNNWEVNYIFQETPATNERKLAVNLRHLATEDNYQSLSYALRFGVSTIFEVSP